MRFTLRLPALLLFATLPGTIGGVAAAQEKEAVVARAGDRFITEREFLERFELTPGLHRQKKGGQEEEKLATLYSLVAEKLLAQEALDRGLDRDSVFQGALREVTRLLARDELYRQEVRRKVTVTAQEIREGMRQARQERRVRYLFCPDSATAYFLKGRIRSAKDFDRMTVDSTLHVLRDTATIVWGDAELEIEAAAYALKEGDVSPVVRAGDGWYLLRLISAGPSDAYAQLSPPVLHERVEDLLRQRKERRRERQFVAEALRGTTAASRPENFRPFAETLGRVMRNHFKAPSTALGPGLADEMRSLLGPSLRDTLVVAGEAVWSMDEVIERLMLRGFAVSGDSVRGIAHRLYTVLEEMAQQELLAQEALRRGLDLVPEVRAKLEPWRDHYLAGIVRRRLNATIDVSESEVYGYLRSKDSGFPVPEIQIRLLRSRSREKIAEALADLSRGVPFAEVVASRAEDPTEREQGGLLPYFPITGRPPLGAIASQLDSGQVYGPIRDSTSFLLMQLVGRRDFSLPGDTSIAGRLGRGRAEVRRMKEKRLATLLIAQSAEKKGFEVFVDRLSALQVSSIPMLAYRLLGFGGRMFEIPFVEPQLQWLETPPPREPVLP